MSPGLGCPDQPPPAGITRFDLLGDFGRFNWLGNFYIVFLYNMGFAGLTTLCLVKRVTWAVQAELIRALGEDGDTGMGTGVSSPPDSHALPLPRSAQAATAGDTLLAPLQTLLGLGNRDVSPPALWWSPGWPPAAEPALMAPGASGALQGEPRPHGGAWCLLPRSTSACCATEPWP